MARRVFGCQGVVSKQGISSLGNVVVHDPFGGESLHNHHKQKHQRTPTRTSMSSTRQQGIHSATTTEVLVKC